MDGLWQEPARVSLETAEAVAIGKREWAHPPG